MINGCDVRPAKWSDVIDLYDDGEYSAIWGRYENATRRVLGVRWNGDEGSKGFPLSSGHPVWHVEPDFLAKGILEEMLNQTLSVAGSGGHKGNILMAMSELAMRRERNCIHLAVALYAAANRGKTKTLKLLIDALKSTDGIKVLEEKPAWKDASDILFCCKYKGKTVGVATGGDECNAVKIAFDFFNTYNCDIVFVATRSRSDSSSWRMFSKNTEERHIRILCVRKCEVPEPDQAAANEAQAKELMALIETNGIA